MDDVALRQRMYRKMRQGKSVLFLGAGASMEAGAPSSAALAALIAENWGLPPDSDLIQTCTKALNTRGIDRTDVENLIRTKLHVRPDQAHINLCRMRWQAIFTTNYDDLIELSYRTATSRAQNRCEVIFDSRFGRVPGDSTEAVRLFKLMGSVTGSDAKSRMALTRSDYNRKLQQRAEVFSTLYDFARDGTIVYIGYSFSDLIAVDIVDEIRDTVELDRLPWSFAVMPEWTADTEQMLRERRILPIQGTFGSVVADLIELGGDDSDRPPVEHISLTVEGATFEMAEIDARMYLRYFDVIHDGTGESPLPSDRKTKADFFEGKLPPWLGIARRWAFNRPCGAAVRKSVQRALTKAQQVPIVVINGPAGSGKSVLVRQIIYNIYHESSVAAIVLKPDREKIDYQVIDAFARLIDESTADARAALEKRYRPPIIIVIDEAAGRVQDFRRLPEFLRARGISAVLLAVARGGEWAATQGEYPVRAFETVEVPHQLQEFPDNSEYAHLTAHLKSIGILSDAELPLVRGSVPEHFDGFWDAVYFLVEPARPPLDLAVRSEYDRLPPLAQDAYRKVSIFFQYGVPLDLEWLARALRTAYDQFVEQIYSPAAQDVVIDELDDRGNLRFRGRSRQVAEQVVRYVYPEGIDAWIDDLIDTIKTLQAHNRNEVETLRSILIRHLGQNGAHRPDNVEAVIKTFNAAINAGIVDSALLHHLGILHLALDALDSAEQAVRRAIVIAEDDGALLHFRTEARQYLYNTLGMVYGRRGHQLEQQGRFPEANRQFELAIAEFRRARFGEFPNSYPYYCEANLLLRRAQQFTGLHRLTLLAEGLQIVDDSDGNIGRDGVASLAEMEARLVEAIVSTPSANEMISHLQADGNPVGEYLFARQWLSVYSGHERAKGTVYTLEAVYQRVQRALEVQPNHIPCLRLASRLHLSVVPGDWKGWQEILVRLSDAEGYRGRPSLLFNLALAAAQMERYGAAHRYFELLDEESQGHARRSGIVAVIRDGEIDRRLAGEVKPRLSRHEGWIACNSIGHDIKFAPIAQEFTVAAGQGVSFVLACNYRGFMATKLRPE